MACPGVLIAHSRAFGFDVDFARVGRTLLSDAFDVDLAADLDAALALPGLTAPWKGRASSRYDPVKPPTIPF